MKPLSFYKVSYLQMFKAAKVRQYPYSIVNTGVRYAL